MLLIFGFAGNIFFVRPESLKRSLVSPSRMTASIIPLAVIFGRTLSGEVKRYKALRVMDVSSQMCEVY